MNSDKMDYKFCADFLRYAYHVMGYEMAVKELNYIHHLYMSPSVSTTNQPVADTSPTVPIEIPSDKSTTTKNIIIDDSHSTKIKYNRSQLSDDVRCNAVISNGSKCSFKRADNCEYCSRHATQSS